MSGGSECFLPLHLLLSPLPPAIPQLYLTLFHFLLLFPRIRLFATFESPYLSIPILRVPSPPPPPYPTEQTPGHSITAARGSPISPALVTTPAPLYLKRCVALRGRP